MIEIRKLTDIDSLLSWRREVIGAVFSTVPDDELMRANRDYYAHAVVNGEHYAVTAALDGTEAGCGSICFGEELPSPENPGGKCAYIMNIYVRPSYRRHGVATAIVGHLVRKARRLECDKIYLESTPQAAPMYRRAGFENLHEMMIYGKTDN